MAISNASNQIVKVNLIPGILVAGNSYWNITDNKIYIEPIGLRVKGNATIEDDLQVDGSINSDGNISASGSISVDEHDVKAWLEDLEDRVEALEQ